MKWITRERVKVDRVACPWLIKNFVDPDAGLTDHDILEREFIIYDALFAECRKRVAA